MIVLLSLTQSLKGYIKTLRRVWRVCIVNSINSTNPTVEIIVVDNNSTDRTKEIAAEYTDKGL